MSQSKAKAERRKRSRKLPAAADRTSGDAPLGGSLRRDLFCLLMVAAAVLLLYGHTLNVPWYFDDVRNITENAQIRDLAGLLKNFQWDRWPAKLSFALNYHIHGYRIAGYHVVNIGIHLLASCLVYLLLKRVFRKSSWLPLAAALIFAVHPLQTQAVTYVVQRMTSLAGLFFFLALYFYVRGRETAAGGRVFAGRTSWLCYGLALLAGLLAVLTKQNTAILPLALWLFDRFFLARPGESPWRPLPYLLPFFLTPALVAVNQLLFPLSGGHSLQAVTSTQGEDVAPLTYLVTEFSVIWLYILRLFVPYPQMLDYNYPVVEQIVTARNLAAFAGVAGLIGAAWALRRRLPFVAFGVFWFLLTLSVESTVIPLDPVFEHRLYLPMFGFGVFSGALLIHLENRAGRRAAAATLLVVVVLLGVLTWKRNHLWNDDLAFFRDNVARTGSSRRMVLALAKRLNEHGLYGEAEEALSGLIERHPNYAKAYVNLSYTYMQQDRVEEGIEVLEGALRRGLTSKRVLNNLAHLYSRQDRHEQAVAIYRKVLESEPHFAAALTNLGNSLHKLGRLAEAEARHRQAIAEVPDLAEAHFNLALVLFDQNRQVEAFEALEEAIRLRPDYGQAWLALGAVAVSLQRMDRAEEALERLRREFPSLADRLEPLLAD